MPRDYNINIAINGGNTRGAFKGGNVFKNKNTLNTKRTSEDGSDTSNFNLSRVINIGLGFNLAQKGNELVGAYTENRLRQRQFNQAMTYAKYGIGLAISPAVGTIYALGDVAYRSAQYGIRVQKGNREADYYRRLSGNNANSGSRYRGDYS